MPDPTPYPELNAILHEMVDNIQVILGDNFLAACLQGSFAVGDFDRDSDLDFIVVTNDELTDDQVAALQAMHPRIYALPDEWAKHLEGSYVPLHVLRDHQQAGGPLWYLDHGSQTMERDAHCNTVVVRWTVREHGVPLAGPHPSTLVDPIPVAVLRNEIKTTLNSWGQEILADPQRYNNRFYQGFIVLNYCRMLHDLQAGTTSSKHTSAEWAKATLDPDWIGLIDRAWDCRPDPARSVRQPANPADFQATLAFVRYIMELCNRA